MSEPFTPSPACLAAGKSTISGLLLQQVAMHPHATAVIEGAAQLSYAELNARVNQLAHALIKLGLRRGDRLALLARNCTAYVEIELAAAKLGVIVAAINWRLVPVELTHCINLASPALLVVAPDYQSVAASLDIDVAETITLGKQYEKHLASQPTSEPPEIADSEDGLVILYTSGTTGLPKGAVISHRAMIARALVYMMDLRIERGRAFIAWPPFFHMASTDHALASLLSGGQVVIVDGYQPEILLDCVNRYAINWLVLIPGMVEEFLVHLRRNPPNSPDIQAIGAMADLVSPHQIAEVSGLLNASYVNSFGATETGLPPASVDLLPIGVAPTDLAKSQSSGCEIKLVGEDDQNVADGEPGECAIRGPTLFSGYWNAPESNAKDFRGGWFHMGDVFRRREDGKLQFMDRSKYMIKSGGENIYPAEIERVLLADSRLDDAVVVRRRDERWGEVPVAAVVCNDATLTEAEMLANCRTHLAGYKMPKELRFVAFEDLPRSTTGKIKRHEVEEWFVDSDGFDRR